MAALAALLAATALDCGGSASGTAGAGGASASSTSASDGAGAATSTSATTPTSSTPSSTSTHTSSATSVGGAGGEGEGGASTSTSASSAGGPGGSPPEPIRVRVVAGNLSSGNFQNYDGGQGKRIFQGLDPDVALVQELNVGDNQDAAVAAFVSETFGPTFSYYREPAVGIPNAVVSRFPILDSGLWDDVLVPDRSFVWAKIDVPGPAPLWAVSLHLRTKTVDQRSQEAEALLFELKKVVQPGDLVVLGGDLNTGSRGEAAVDVLRQLVVAEAPYPADQAGNEATNAPRSQALDWVIGNAPLHAATAPVVIGSQSFEGGLVLDTRLFTPLADVAPALSGDSGAVGMQHMAVVRDFLLTP